MNPSRPTVRAGYSRIRRLRSCCRVYTFTGTPVPVSPPFHYCAIRAAVVRVGCSTSTHPWRKEAKK